MTLSKSAILDVVKQMPDDIDVEELIHRLVLLQKLAAAEADIEAGRVLTHDEMKREAASWSTR